MPDEREELGVEEEVGATSGETHDQVLQRALGRERGLRAATSDGPPAPRRKDAQKK